MKANQARQSVEDSKRLTSDKSFRNKQDKDRRLRELNSNNVKRFMEERKRLANKHKAENDLLENITKEEIENLTEENKKVDDDFRNNLLPIFYHFMHINNVLNSTRAYSIYL